MIPRRPAPLLTAASDAGNALHRTVRIEHDRRRLALRLLASAVALLAACAAFVSTWLHAGAGLLHDPALPPPVQALLRATTVPWWATFTLGVAVLGAAVGVLRSIYRLQDGDAALVVSPQGLKFRPSVFGETASIPWHAIRGVRLVRLKNQRSIALAVANVDRYVAHVGLRARLRNSISSTSPAPEILFTSALAPDDWKRTVKLLQDYLVCYGQRAPAQAAQSTGASASERTTHPKT